MKKERLIAIVILLAVLALAGCAPSWQSPIMGPDMGIRDEAAAVTVVSAPISDSNDDGNVDTLPAVVVVPGEAPVHLAAPTITPSTRPADDRTPRAAATAPAAEPAPPSEPVRVQFPPDTSSTVLEGALRAAESDALVFHARAEQMVTLALSFVGVEGEFALSGVASGKRVRGQNVTEQLWSAVLPQSQDYLLLITAPDELPPAVPEIPYHLVPILGDEL